MLPISRARATASLVALSLAALLVLPGVALADATTPPGKDDAGTTGAGPSQLPSAAADRAHEATSQPPGGPPANDDGTGDDTDSSTGDGEDGSTGDGEDGSTGDGEDGTGTDPADEDDTTITLPTPVREEILITACAPHLVTFTRDGFDGDDTAVALTSQAVDAEQPGWLHVTWEAATGTELEAVELLHADGNRSVRPATATGTVYDIVEVTFCGRTDDTADTLDASDAPQDGADGDAEAPAADAEDATVDTPVPPPANTAGNVSAPSGNLATSAGTASTDAATAGDEAGVEVLGVQIVAPERDAEPEGSDDQDEPDDEPTAALAAAPALAGTSSGSGGLHPLLLAAAIAAGLAGAVTVLRSTSRATTSSTTQGDLS